MIINPQRIKNPMSIKIRLNTHLYQESKIPTLKDWTDKMKKNSHSGKDQCPIHIVYYQVY